MINEMSFRGKQAPPLRWNDKHMEWNDASGGGYWIVRLTVVVWMAEAPEAVIVTA
jgi:hypothetical protein